MLATAATAAKRQEELLKSKHNGSNKDIDKDDDKNKVDGKVDSKGNGKDNNNDIGKDHDYKKIDGNGKVDGKDKNNGEDNGKDNNKVNGKVVDDENENNKMVDNKPATTNASMLAPASAAPPSSTPVPCPSRNDLALQQYEERFLKWRESKKNESF